MEPQHRNGADPLAVLWPHRRVLFGVALGAAVLAALLSGPWLVKPRYTSYAVVYPTNMESYAGESRTEQLLQLMEGNSIRDSLVQRFGLVERYGIDTTSARWRAKLLGVYRGRVEVARTRYESVRLEVEDEDPKLARAMALELVRQTDALALRLHREKSAERSVIARERWQRTTALLDSVEARLDTLRVRGGMLDYDSQSRELVRGYMRLLAQGGGENARKEVQGLIQDLERQGGAFKGLTDLGRVLREDHAIALMQYEAAMLDLTKELTYTHVVVQPEVSDKPSHPVRWLVVLLAASTAVLLTALLLIWRRPRTPGRP